MHALKYRPRPIKDFQPDPRFKPLAPNKYHERIIAHPIIPQRPVPPQQALQPPGMPTVPKSILGDKSIEGEVYYAGNADKNRNSVIMMYFNKKP